MRLILASVLTSFFSRGFGISRAALRVSAVVFLLLMTHQVAHGFVVTTPGKNKPCVVTGLNFEGSTDLEALNQQEEAVAALLKREKSGESAGDWYASNSGPYISPSTRRTQWQIAEPQDCGRFDSSAP